MEIFPKVLLVAALVLPVVLPMTGGEAFAQRPFQRLQRDLESLRPDGRILRELFGDQTRKPQPTKAQLEEQLRRPQAAKNRGPQPTPVGQQNTNDQAKPRAPGNPSVEGAQPETTRHPSRLEILVRESSKPEGLIVDKINSSGAAWAAGIRRGDLITTVGGLKTSSKDAIAEIINVMKDGDQIEFEYVRQGKQAKTIVQLGDLPKEDLQKDGDVPSNNSRSAGDAASHQPPVQANTPTQFNNGGLNSVLDRSLIQDRSTTEPGFRQPPQTPQQQQNRRGLRRNWQVQPPQASRTTPNYTQPASMDISALQRQLEQRQREIAELEEQIRRANGASTTPPGKFSDPSAVPDPDLDSLLDFDDK